jgi:hypothetical protein
MNDNTIRARLMEIVDILLVAPDEFGLNEVCAHVKYDLAIADDSKVKDLTLAIVRDVAAGRGRGLRSEYFHGPSNRETTPDEIVACIDREWDAIGEMPTLPGEICFFQWTPSAMEAYARRQGLPPEHS